MILLVTSNFWERKVPDLELIILMYLLNLSPIFLRTKVPLGQIISQIILLNFIKL